MTEEGATWRKIFITEDCAKTRSTDPDVYVPKLKETFKDSMLRKLEIPPRQGEGDSPEKVLMLVGATGAGKTTMINALFNYVVGVHWNDKYRLRLVQEEVVGSQAQSQTSFITAYTVNPRPGFRVPFRLKVIDTPGFGDTRGVDRDKRITEMIRKFFTSKGENGIDRLDAVGFVIPAPNFRLTKTQKYILYTILELFGKDFGKNIFLLFTWAQSEKPKALDAVDNAKLPYETFYKFNNGCVYVNPSPTATKGEDSDDEGSDFNRMFWDMGMNSFSRLMKRLDRMQPVSLTLTKEVMRERSLLEAAIDGIRENIQLSLNTLQQLKAQEEALQKHTEDMEKNKQFTYMEVQQVVHEMPTQPGRYGINCKVCNVTCCGSCTIGENKDIVLCRVIGEPEGNCRRCPNKCHWSKHEANSYRLVFRTVRAQKTQDELKVQYEEALGGKVTAQTMIAECRARIESVEAETMQHVVKARDCIARIRDIALKPNPMTAADYVDGLIRAEMDEQGPGWEERAARLRVIRAAAEQLTAAGKRGAPTPGVQAAGRGQTPGVQAGRAPTPGVQAGRRAPTPGVQAAGRRAPALGIQPLPALGVHRNPTPKPKEKGVFGFVKRIWRKITK